MSEIKQFLEPQAQWQKRRRALSWPEKLRMAEQIRASIAQWHSIAGKDAHGAPNSNPAG